MWTSSNGRRVLERVAGSPQLLYSYACTFQAMVNPGDELFTQVRHVGNVEGRKVVEVESVNGEGVCVLKGTAQIDLPKTAIVFTGQGSAEPGMEIQLQMFTVYLIL